MVDSWRNRATGRAAASGPASWRKPSSPKTRTPYWQGSGGRSLFSRRQVKLAVLGLLSLGLLAWFVRLITAWNVKLPVIALAVVGFNDPIPPNALAWEDVGRLEEVLGNYDNISLQTNPRVVGSGANLLSTVREAIARAQPGGPAKDTILVYLSAHGVVNQGNQPCLLVERSQARDSGTWLPVDELLQTLIQAKAPGDRLVLLLDAGKLDHVWPMGVAYNTFAERLSDLIEQNRAAYPRLVVINSHGPRQAGQLAPEAGGSAFGFFVSAGLRGEAAGDDDQITLAELHQYLQSTVDSFARERRLSRQVPQLLPSEPVEFPLDHAIAHATGRAVPALHPRDLAAQQSTVSELWHRYNALMPRQPEHLDPVAWAVLRQKLVRVDALLVAGAAYEGQLDWTINEIRSSLTQFEALRPRDEQQLGSLASQRAVAPPDANELQQAKESVAQWEQQVAAAAEGAAPPPPALRYPIAAELVWEAALSTPPSRQQIVARLRLLPEGEGAPEVDYAEIQYLRLLLAGIDWQQVSPAAISRALQVEALSEQAAAPMDNRSLYWIAPRLAEVDEAARRASDQLFVGTPEALQLAEKIWSKQVDYAGLIEISQRVSQAYALRDTAWADGPFLAQWLLSSASTAKNATLRTALDQLGTATHQLARTLDEPPATATETQPFRDLDAAAVAVERSLRTLQDAFQQTYRRLWEERGNDQQTLQQIGVLLQVPLVPGDIRIRDDLWKRYFTQWFSAQALTTQAEAPSASGAVPDEDPLAWHATDTTHPILALLDRRALDAGDEIPAVRLFPAVARGDRSEAEVRADRLMQLAEWGGEVRARLNDLPGSAQRLSEDTARAVADESLPPMRRVRQGLSRADRLVRAASPMLVASPWSQPEQDPVVQLLELDDHQELLEQAGRRLRDFWAAAEGGSRPYFAVVTERLLATARQRFRPAQRYRDQVQAALAAAETALQTWQPLTAESRSFTSDETFVRHSVRWQADPQLPQGVVAVRVDKLGGQPAPLMDSSRSKTIGRRAVDTSSDAELQHVILTQQGLGQSNALEAIAFYRGHVRRAGFYLNAGTDAAVARYQRPAEVRPRIRVRNAATEKSNVIFILDCSRSMRYRHNYEGIEQTRLQIATSTLTTVLQKLDPELYRIGVLIYGSRSSWQREGNRIFLPPAQVHPAIDVDEALALSPILQADPRTGRRVDVRDDLYDVLRRLSFRGDTPLYYSIIRGIRAMQTANPDGPRHLVVITDGVDSTYGNREFPIPDFARTTAEDVKKELDATGIQLHVVGFSAPPNQPEDRAVWEKTDKPVWEQKRSEISGLATGGFLDVLSPEGLERALVDSLQLKKFYVLRPGSSPPDPRSFVDLGRSWQIGVTEPLGRYQVVLAESPQVNSVLDAENGDWFELLYYPQRGTLEHQRFDRELRGQATVDRYFVGAHLPVRESPKELSFFLSVQSAEASRFSPRPDAVWAEFQPILPAGAPATPAPPSFVAYDLEFEPKNPVPVLRFRLAGWPELVDEQAVARLWFAPSGTFRPSAVRQLSLQQVDAFDLAGAHFSVELRSGRVNESSRILIDEEHPNAADEFPLHVRLEPPADSAHHVFLPQSRRVQHVFVYDDRTPAQLQLQVTSPQQLKRTWIDSGPLPVELPNR